MHLTATKSLIFLLFEDFHMSLRQVGRMVSFNPFQNWFLCTNPVCAKLVQLYQIFFSKDEVHSEV